MNRIDCMVYRRVAFRPTTPADLAFVISNERHPDNAPFIRHWTDKQHLAAITNPDVGHFIVERVRDRKPIGHVILVGLHDTDLCLELRRIVIAEKRLGYGREALRLVMSHAFKTLGFHRLWLDVAKDNKRAYRLYRSEGFSVDGLNRQAFRQGEGFKDLMVMSVLSAEFFECLYRNNCGWAVVFPDGERPGQCCIR